MYYGLSNPKSFKKDEFICTSIKTIYEEFKETFLLKERREMLKGSFIYVDNKNIYNVNKRFLHAISIRDKQYYSSYPCINDISRVLCFTECDFNSVHNIECIKKLKRSICYYRLARIHWIPEIIHLANNDDVNIKIWSKNFYDKTTGQTNIVKRFVWYKSGLANYVIIFEEKYKKGKLNFLEFVTGYPVFGKKTERDFVRDYNLYIKNKKPALS